MIATIIISLILLAVTAAIIRNLIKKKLEGKSTCGCDCSSCSCGCHTDKTQK